MPRGSILHLEHHFDQHLPMSGEARAWWVVTMPKRLGIAQLTGELQRSKSAVPAQGPAEVSM